MAKVVTFGAFVEILPGVEGLVHISELAAHHVENPREVVSQGQAVNVRILEIDGDRRRLSLSLKRVEEGDQPVPRADGAESVHETPNLVLSEEAFPAGGATSLADEEGDVVDVGDDSEDAGIEIASEAVAEIGPEADAEIEPEADAEIEPEVDAEPEIEAVIQPEASADPLDEVEAAGEPGSTEDEESEPDAEPELDEEPS